MASVADCLESDGIETRLNVLAKTGAKRDKLGGIDDWRRAIVIHVNAQPVQGLANDAIGALLKDIVGARATVVRGHTSTQKVVRIDAPPEEVIRKLEKAIQKFC